MSDSFLAAVAARATDATSPDVYSRLLHEEVSLVPAAARLVAREWPATAANVRKMTMTITCLHNNQQQRKLPCHLLLLRRGARGGMPDVLRQLFATAGVIKTMAAGLLGCLYFDPICFCFGGGPWRQQLGMYAGLFQSTTRTTTLLTAQSFADARIPGTFAADASGALQSGAARSNGLLADPMRTRPLTCSVTAACAVPSRRIASPTDAIIDA